MKKIIILFVMILMTFSLVSCSQETSTSTSSKYKVILLIPGNLGDKSFFDAANAGMSELSKMPEYETKVIEMTADEQKWEPAILDAIDEGYNLIISGNAASDTMNKLAKQHPDSKFLNFDNSGTDAPENVYSVAYSTNEGSFLAGALAALMTTKTNVENINDQKIIGFLGGMDIPGINDFLVGYIQGAQFVDKDVKVVTTYAASFVDPAKGKELSLGMYNLGADIAFNVAGQTGLGLIDAAFEANKYAIGVDSDQAALYKDKDPKKALKVLTSVIKQINKVIVNNVKKAKEGTLEYGKHELLGLKQEAVSLADNEFYQKVPEDIRKQITDIRQQIIDGKIKVQSAFNMPTEEIVKLRDAVKPR